MAVSFRLNADEERRLDALSKRTGRSKSFYVREALQEHLENLEDAYAAHDAYVRHVESGSAGTSLDDFAAELFGEDEAARLAAGNDVPAAG